MLDKYGLSLVRLASITVHALAFRMGGPGFDSWRRENFSCDNKFSFVYVDREELSQR